MEALSLRFGLPHECAIADYLCEHDALVVLSSGFDQYYLACCFVERWYARYQAAWEGTGVPAVPVIVCLGLSDTAELEYCVRSYRFGFPREGLAIKMLTASMSAKDRTDAVCSGGLLVSASTQTWILDLLQYRVVGSVIDGVLVFNAEHVLQKRTSSFVIQLVTATSCGKKFFLKGFCASPNPLALSISSLERAVAALNTVSQDNVILAPCLQVAAEKTDNKIQKYLNRYCKKYFRFAQSLVQASPNVKLIWNSLLAVRDKLEQMYKTMADSTQKKEDLNIVDLLAAAVLYEDARDFLHTFMCTKSYCVRQNVYSWFTTYPELADIQCAAIARVVIKNDVEQVEPVLEPNFRISEVINQLTQLLKSAPARSRTRVLILQRDAIGLGTLINAMRYGLRATTIDSMRNLCLKSKTTSSYGELLSARLSEVFRIVSDLSSPAMPPPDHLSLDEPCPVPVDLSTFRAIQALGPPTIVEECFALIVHPSKSMVPHLLKLNPTHIILPYLDLSVVRELQVAATKMHMAADWLLTDLNSMIKLEPEPDPSSAKRRRVAAAVAPEPYYHGARLTHWKYMKSEGDWPVKRAREELKEEQTVQAANSEDKFSSLSDVRNAVWTKMGSGAEGQNLHQTLGGWTCTMTGLDIEAAQLKEWMLAERKAWEMLFVNRNGMFVMKQASMTEIAESMPTTEDRLAYTVMMMGGSTISSMASTRRGGGGLAALLQNLKQNVVVSDDILKASPAKLIEAMRGVVIVDIRELRSALPYELWRSGIRILPMVLETADYILTPKIGIERKAITDLMGSLSSGRLLSQVQRLTACFEQPALLVELPNSQFYYKFSAVPEAVAQPNQPSDPALIPKLCVLVANYPKMRLLWTCAGGGAFTSELFKTLKRFQRDPDMADARKSRDLTTGRVIRRAVDSSNPAAAEALTLVPTFNTAACDSVVTVFESLRDCVSASQEKLEEALGTHNGAAAYRFFHTDFRTHLS